MKAVATSPSHTILRSRLTGLQYFHSSEKKIGAEPLLCRKKSSPGLALQRESQGEVSNSEPEFSKKVVSILSERSGRNNSFNPWVTRRRPNARQKSPPAT